MIKYFKKSFIRYLAYGLAIALLSFIFGLFKVKAEELEYITATKTSLHTYISTTNIGSSSSTLYYSSSSYREITGSQNEYTFTGTVANPKTIMKLAYNVFGNFQVNNSYKIRWEAKFPNSIDISKYTCSMGSYDNNTAYPPWSLSSCEIKRSNSGYIIMEGTITIERGQYVTLVITPKLGIDTNFTYDLTDPLLPDFLEGNFTLSYGTPQILKLLPISAVVGGLASNIDGVTGAVNNVKSSVDNVGSGINDIKNSLTDSNPPDNLSALSNSAGWLPAGPVDSILNLPLSLLNNLITNMQRTCTPVTLPLPYVDDNLELPCVNSLYSQMGDFSTFINGTVGVIASAFILFYYLMHLYKYVDDTLTFRENNFIDNWSGV